MKLIELHIISFGGLCETKLSLSDRLNLILGENESGKSTWMLFIKFMLYGMPRKGSEERERSVSRTDHRAAGSMTLSYQNEIYRIERSFVEQGRTSGDRCAIYRVSDGVQVFRDREPAEVFLKVPREVFESSACVGQMKCEPTAGKKGTDAIRNLLTGADESTDLRKVTDTMEKIRVTYRHKSGKGGKLADGSARLHSERQRLEKAVADRVRMAELEQRAKQIGGQWEEAEAQWEQANRRLQAVARADLVSRFDALHQKEAELPVLERRIEECKRQYLQTERIPTEGDAVLLRELADGLDEAVSAEEMSRQEWSEWEDRESFDEELARQGLALEEDGGPDGVFVQMEELKKRRGRNRAMAGLLLVAGLGGAALAAFLGQWLIALPAGAAGLLLCVLLLGRSGRWSREARELAAAYGATPKTLSLQLSLAADALAKRRGYEATLAQRKQTHRQAEARRAQLERRLSDQMTRHLPAEAFVPSPEGARELAERLQEFLAQYGALRHQQAVLFETVRADRQALSGLDEQELRTALSEYGDREALPDLKRAEFEQKYLASQRDLLRQKKERAEVERISLRATAEDPVPLSDRVAKLEKEYERAESYCEALELALEALQEAGESMSGTVTPILGKRAGEMLAIISDGAYADLSAGNDLSPTLSHADGFFMNADLLSGGTRDLAYLTLRLSLMLYLFEEELPPLLMDESLCQLDEGRMGRTLSLLSKLCEGHFQCLLFSCHKREESYCRQEGLDCHIIRV